MPDRELLAILAAIILSGSYSREHGFRIDTQGAARVANMLLKAVDAELAAEKTEEAR
jgi:hypothetical protein